MGRPSKTKTLRLMMNGEPVGNWTVRANGMHEFSYDSTWIASPLSRPISLSMPLRKEKYSGEPVYAYFDNLLPNNDAIRKRIQNRFATSGIDPFSLLSETGRDCVGAIQLLTPDSTGEDVHKIRATPIDQEDIDALLKRSVQGRDFGKTGREGDEFRISLAGAQEKTALLFHNGQWMIPHGPTPTTHIFKLPLGHIGQYNLDMTSSIEKEWLCGRLLQAYGLPTANATVATFGDTKALIVERFDRKLSRDGSWIIRLPQEDLCQATGTPPWNKYESDGGPGIKAIMTLLLGSDRASQDRKMFFRAQVAFYLLCAIDGHAKNFSIVLGPGGTFHLTPLYDVLSAYPVIGSGPKMLPKQKVKMAMALWGKNRIYRWDAIMRRHFMKTGTDCGLALSDSEAIIGDMVRLTPQVLEQTANALPAGFPEQVLTTITEGVQERCRRLS
ncbi:MAG: type II toxin-antitoxin system HipA family toxin [Chlorobiaceae bacterium]|nr:type II toxin-antitoxin system HipA family toxin [Chlorobiaceae bacterium]